MAKKFFSFVWEILKITIIASAIVLPVRYFLFQPFLVKGPSMEPNFTNNDYLIIDEISYRFRAFQRGEVVVFKFPLNTSQMFIKRIIGLPGDMVEINNGEIKISKDGKTEVLDESEYLNSTLKTEGNISVVLNQNEYFVLGDNREASFDSRRFGVLPENDIIGRVVFRAWPFAALAAFGAPVY
ncbi:MAG: signal peptidase I [Candidatus Nealsonbacteria bacterium RIFCSPLOWO2_12_FULL_39_31]|uniref:Signal peptidase I n=3 Tax=Candidatus Nealsoniibacteriota TaxID=1817911 RepID=A0A1G2ELN9_9BACT|nr:MAG: Signal peptidase I [Parcubacteria group bacterium GW2011_GWA2_38_27]KKQ98340.1 MAG: Signal peptidase I [Parcubacteria group bacterium GW2011_GWC2_39_11]OGZ19725.1 MAG: signal peptidase I [Candidatus Nealsonbacteria bacterium RIFCSPHIGHO2_01_FULL_38_55]OGZ20982.1 MAG: signal peptidase I [Candidatus Nealsonbacteria bacterium RIFCSPHIGHO2_02_38_10]OGZ21032.1 MAG: signal peptidase I [Candidatus Nealsonbacteria bacterium RIFCSPHIGHO2_02_FULL_38_75]OGZ22539.1 MAG: signal peptidase I [Candida